jgi:four helix bundle protein
MNNIAEGFERMSDGELRHFLYMAKESAGEIRSMLYLAKDFGYIGDEKIDELMELSKLISGMLANFIKSLNKSSPR